MYVLKMVTFELFLTIRQPLVFEIICLILVSGSAYALYVPFYHVYSAPHNQVWVKPLNWQAILLAREVLLAAV